MLRYNPKLLPYEDAAIVVHRVIAEVIPICIQIAMRAVMR
jgi:hypothetical protein